MLNQRRSGDDYTAALEALLPRGSAWPRDEQSDLMRLVAGLARVWADVDGRAADLLEIETDPRLTNEMLLDWERAFGLPEVCPDDAAPDRFRVSQGEAGNDALLHVNTLKLPTTTGSLTLEQRHARLIAKIKTQGGQSRAFFIGTAAQLGYTITLDEFSPLKTGVSRCGDTRSFTGTRPTWFRCGVSRCGLDHHLTLPSDFKIVEPPAQTFGNAANRFIWRVNVVRRAGSRFRVGLGGGQCGVTKLLKSTPRPNRFRVGSGGGRVGQDPLLHVERALDLECVFRRLKPAQTEVTFNYGRVQ